MPVVISVEEFGLRASIVVGLGPFASVGILTVEVGEFSLDEVKVPGL